MIPLARKRSGLLGSEGAPNAISLSPYVLNAIFNLSPPFPLLCASKADRYARPGVEPFLPLQSIEPMIFILNVSRDAFSGDEAAAFSRL
jgi:hypothetical protein